MSRRSLLQMLLRIAQAAALPCLLANCSGSPEDDGGGGTGTGGGIGGSGLVSTSDIVIGEITGFGSVFVNNERFDTSDARIIINGEPSDESLLSIGMRVVANADVEKGIASSIDYLPSLIGPITDSSPDNRNFRVLGQDIVYSPSTQFVGLSAVDLNAGFVVEVSGTRNARNQINATFVRAANNAPVYQLSGNVTSTSSNGMQLQIGEQQINVSGIDLEQLNALGSLQGLDVNITIPLSSQVPGVSILDGSAISAASRPVVAIGSQLRVSGLVKSFNLGTFILIDRYSVVVDEDVDIQFFNGGPATLNDIAIDSLIEVTAIATGISLLVADRIVIF